MRFATALILPALLAAPVLADSCTCPSDNSGGSGNGYWNPYSNPAPVQEVPKVEATKQNLNQGVNQALSGLQQQNILPPEVAQPVQQAIQQYIAQAPKQVAVQMQGEPTPTTITVTPVPTTITSTLTGLNVSDQTLTITKTVTALPPGATILPNQTIVALQDIQQAIDDAIAAVNLSKTGLDDATQAELSTCLKAVLENGGLPAGYSCISQSGSTSAGLKSTFNNVLEQFIGILPAKLIDDLQGAVMPMLTGLLPSEATLLGNINSAISSVVASLSGNTVTAVEMMQSCYSMAIRQNGNTSYLQCYMSSGGPFDTMETAMNSVIQQFVGYLPGTVLESVSNLTASTLKAGAYEDVSSIGTSLTQQLNDALASVTSALTGNSVTLMQELQACANELLVNGNATAAATCVAKDPAASARTMVNSVAQQFSGYLPSAFFSDLVSIVSNMTTTGNYSKTQIISALDAAFNNANMGPAYVGCFEQVQTCLLDEIVATGNYSSTCAGPVKGCELIGSQNSTGLANTTIAPATPAVAQINATAPVNVTAIASNDTSAVVPSPPVVKPVAAFGETNSTKAEASAVDTSALPSSSSVWSSSSASSSSASSSSSWSSSASSSEHSTSHTSSASSSSAETKETSSSVPASSSAAASKSELPSASSKAAGNGTAETTKRAKRGHQKLRMTHDSYFH